MYFDHSYSPLPNYTRPINSSLTIQSVSPLSFRVNLCCSNNFQRSMVNLSVFLVLFPLSFLSLNIVNTLLAFGGITLNPSLRARIWSGLGLSRVFACCCNCSEFLCASAMLYQMIILPCSHPLHLTLLLFLSALL